MKKSILTVLSLLAFTFPACTSEDFYSDWGTNYASALETARGQDKLVFIEFANTYTCPHCVRFRKNVLSDPAFKEFAEDKLVRLLVDNPRKPSLPADLREQNQRLWGQYNVRGTPTVVVLDPSGQEIFRNVGYSGAPASRVVESLSDLYQNEFTSSAAE